MDSVLSCFLWACSVTVGAPGAPVGETFLYQPAYSLGSALRLPAEPYCPQPGDIMLATDDNRFWRITHNLAGAGYPHHSGIVFARSDGRIALLESGPNDCLHIRSMELVPHLLEYDRLGPVWIRKRCVPLTAEQSAALTHFCETQDGKHFALIRLGMQLTPFRSRGPIRTHFMGGPHGDRFSYFCSELVTEACVAAGLLDPTTTRPAATYPSDLFFDCSPNPYIDRHLKLAPQWNPPARWTTQPVFGDAPIATVHENPQSTSTGTHLP